MTDNPARRLFVDIIEFLDRIPAKYLLIRNYEGYPEAFTGDVDIYAELDRIRPELPALIDLCEEAGWHVMRTVERPWIIALQCVRVSDGSERSAMVIEFFDRFCWLQFPYASFSDVWGARSEHRGLTVVEPNLGVLITLAHYLYWAGFVPQKYRELLLAASADPHFSRWCRMIFGGYIGPRVEVWLTQSYLKREADTWEKRTNVPELLAEVPTSLVLRAKAIAVLSECVRHPIRASRKMLGVGLIQVKEFVVVRGDILLVSHDGWEVLLEVKKFHLYKNRNTILLRGDDLRGIRLMRAVAAAYWAMSRGGLCIVERGDGDQTAVRWLTRIFGSHVKELSQVGEANPASLIDRTIGALR